MKQFTLKDTKNYFAINRKFKDVWKKIMEDYLLDVSVEYVDTGTGEVISKSNYHKPLSVFQNDDIQRHVDAFVRGIRQGRDINVNISIVKSRDLPQHPFQLNIF